MMRSVKKVEQLAIQARYKSISDFVPSSLKQLEIILSLSVNDLESEGRRFMARALS